MVWSCWKSTGPSASGAISDISRCGCRRRKRRCERRIRQTPGASSAWCPPSQHGAASSLPVASPTTDVEVLQRVAQTGLVIGDGEDGGGSLGGAVLTHDATRPSL